MYRKDTGEWFEHTKDVYIREAISIMESLFNNLAAIEKFMHKLRRLIVLLIVVFSMALCVSIAGSVVLVVNCVITYQQSKQQMERLRERRDYIRDSLSVEL